MTATVENPSPKQLGLPLQGKVALVTGASKGIGRAIALELAAHGADVAVHARTAEAAAEVAEAVRALGRKAHVVEGDVAQTAADELLASVTGALGRLDILVNNAGITRDTLLLRMKDDDWDAVLQTNLTAAFKLVRAAAKLMMKQKGGRIINVSSIVGLVGNPGQANYAASKAGLIGLTKAVAKELASRGITVNAVAPGYIDTAMTGKISDSVKETLLKTIPAGTMGDPSDVAAAVRFLATDEARYITGHVLNVDGGLAM